MVVKKRPNPSRVARTSKLDVATATSHAVALNRRAAATEINATIETADVMTESVSLIRIVATRINKKVVIKTAAANRKVAALPTKIAKTIARKVATTIEATAKTRVMTIAMIVIAIKTVTTAAIKAMKEARMQHLAARQTSARATTLRANVAHVLLRIIARNRLTILHLRLSR